MKAQMAPNQIDSYYDGYSCVVPLTETAMEIGDRHYNWGQNGVKGYDP